MCYFLSIGCFWYVRIWQWTLFERILTTDQAFSRFHQCVCLGCSSIVRSRRTNKSACCLRCSSHSIARESVTVFLINKYMFCVSMCLSAHHMTSKNLYISLTMVSNSFQHFQVMLLQLNHRSRFSKHSDKLLTHN